MNCLRIFGKIVVKLLEACIRNGFFSDWWPLWNSFTKFEGTLGADLFVKVGRVSF